MSVPEINLQIPSYIKNDDQDFYHAEMNQTLRQLLSTNGWQTPNLTAAQVTALTNMINAGTYTTQLGTIWFNTDVGKLQVITALGPVTVETITSA